jgi:hypothetical protein
MNRLGLRTESCGVDTIDRNIRSIQALSTYTYGQFPVLIDQRSRR